MNFEANEREQSYLSFMSAIGILVYFILFISFLLKPLLLPLILFYITPLLLFRLVISAIFIGYIKGNAIKISEKQFPEVFDIIRAHSQKLELNKVPEMYILQGNGVLNAFATRFSKKNFVVLYSDVFELAYENGKDAVSFVLGHELGHIKRNHVSFLKSILILPAKFIPFLSYAYSRACEYTCDSIGYNLAPKGAINGLLILVAGKKLYKKVDVSNLINNVDDHKGFAFWVAEIFSTHPHLVKRLAVFNDLDLNKLESDDFDFVIPKEKIKHTEI